MLVDLHIHSIFSDGTKTPDEIVLSAKHKRIAAISITDHDTVSGVEEALEAGEKHGVEVFPGLELSVQYENNYIHILGYCMDYRNLGLEAGLSRLQDARERRNREIIVKLNELGIAISLSDVKRISRKGQTGRPHIAKILMSMGVVGNMNQAFEKYLKKGSCAYVSRFIYSAEEAITLIKEAGGFAILAHPLQVDNTLRMLPDLFEALVAFGLDGVELHYPTHSLNTRKKIRKITKGYNFLYTGGSDYHGDIRPGTSLASGKKMVVCDEVLAHLRKKWIINKRSR